ncbi:MAG: O-antigen ligase family protein [Myxococcota bacterium]|nr:O-antigen ligase family protein [Myxococcota bacterium]
MPLAVAVFGLLLCWGILSIALPPPIHRMAKHAFYLGVMGLVLLDAPRALQVARRDPWIWALVALTCLSSAWSQNPAWALKQSVVMAQTTLFGLYLAMRFPLAGQVRLLLWLLGTLLVANTVYLFIAPESVAFMDYQGQRAYSGFLGHKNAIGWLGAVALPVFAMQLGARGLPRIAAVGGIALSVFLIHISLSRTGLGAGLVLTAMVLLLPIARRMRRPVLVLVPLAFVVLGTLTVVSGAADWPLELLGRSSTLSGRTDIWRESLSVFLQRPLLGHSIASNWQMALVERTGFWFSNAHNGFIQQLVELGIVGFGLLLILVLSILWRGLGGLAHGGRTAIWPLCMCSLFVIYNLFEVLLMRPNSFPWLMLVAASLAIPRRPSSPAPPRRARAGRSMRRGTAEGARR